MGTPKSQRSADTSWLESGSPEPPGHEAGGPGRGWSPGDPGGVNQNREARPTPRLKFQETHPAPGEICEIPLVLERILRKFLGFPV